MKKMYMSLLSIVFLLSFIVGCSSSSNTSKPAQDSSKPTQDAAKPADDNSSAPKEMTLATTTSTQDSGLLDYLIPIFEKKTGIKVKVVAVGTGQAIKLGEDGNADVVLVHARPAEDKFVKDGFGVDAYDVMYNQFYIVGPKDDPAGLKAAKTTSEAMKLLADKKVSFISRGDNSGTEQKEKTLWQNAKMTPSGDWYLKSGQGMGATLKMADEKKGYTLTDEATFLSQKGKLNLDIDFQGQPELFNPYGIIEVKSTKKHDLAQQLIHFFVDPDGQKLISEFGKDKYGKGLFVPDAKKR